MNAAERKQMTATVFGRAAATYEQVVPFFTTPGRRLVELADIRPDMTVLDLGAGRGAVTIPAAEAVGANGRVVAGDIATEMVELLRADVARLGLLNVEVDVIDAEEPPGEPASYDRILLAFVIFFLPDPRAALRRYAELLRPEGRIGLTIFPGTDDRWKFWGEMIDELEPPNLRSVKSDDPGPVGSPDNLAATLADCGFRDITQVEEAHDVVFPDVDHWWDWVWSQGQRAALEKLPADVLPDFREKATRRAAELAGPDGSLVLRQPVTYTSATPG